jgi:hypothetical protein
MSTSNFLDDSHSSKRPLIHAGTERSQGLVNSSSIDFYSEDGTPNHIQPFKRVRLGDILDQDTLHNIHVS